MGRFPCATIKTTTPTSQTCLSHWSSSELFSLSGRLPPLSERLPSLIRWSPNLQRAPRWRASRTAATSQSSSKLTSPTYNRTAATAAPHTTAILGAATLEEHARCRACLVEEHVTAPGTRRVMRPTIAFVLWDCVRSRARAFPRSKREKQSSRHMDIEDVPVHAAVANRDSGTK